MVGRDRVASSLPLFRTAPRPDATSDDCRRADARSFMVGTMPAGGRGRRADIYYYTSFTSYDFILRPMSEATVPSMPRRFD